MDRKSIFGLIVGVCAALFSCTSNDNVGADILNVEPGEYTIGINLDAEVPLTRGISGNTFDAVYEPDVIYIHKYEEGDAGEKKVVTIPIIEQLECEDGNVCKGFRFQVEVDEDGRYTVTPFSSNDDNSLVTENAVTFEAGDNVYFSSLPTRNWSVQENCVVDENSDSQLYIRDDINNVEIYRSQQEKYSLQDLVVMGGDLTMERKCSAFDGIIVFTDTEGIQQPEDPTQSGVGQLTYGEFTEVMHSSPYEWYAKIVIGPFFSGNFDMQNGEDVSGKYGFYVANHNQYTAFAQTSFDPIVGDAQSGYGYQTDDKFPLIAPFDTSAEGELNRDRLSIYIFIKHWEGGIDNLPSPDWLSSDEGAMYTVYRSDTSIFQENFRYPTGLLIDIHDLANAFGIGETDSQGLQTRVITGKQYFEIPSVEFFIGE